MAITSFFWDGEEIGHARYGVSGNFYGSPYKADAFNFLFARLISSNTVTDGVLPTFRSGMDGYLAVTAGADKVTVATGAAIVDGSIYINDAAKDITIDKDGYYLIVLRKSYAAKTVRASLLGPASLGTGGNAYPRPVQNAMNVWDLPLAQVTRISDVVSVSFDVRRFIRNFKFDYRKGGSATDWSTRGTNNYLLHSTHMLIGSADISSTNTTVTFTEAFSAAPVVIACVYGTNGAPSSTKWYLIDVTSTYFTFSVTSVTTADTFSWVAFGEKA